MGVLKSYADFQFEDFEWQEKERIRKLGKNLGATDYEIDFPRGSSHTERRWNFSIVHLGRVRLAFSYRTIIGFGFIGGGPDERSTIMASGFSWTWYHRESIWGQTTGGHLADLERYQQSTEVDDPWFFEKLQQVMEHPRILLETEARRTYESINEMV